MGTNRETTVIWGTYSESGVITPPSVSLNVGRNLCLELINAYLANILVVCRQYLFFFCPFFKEPVGTEEENWGLRG